MELTSVKRKVNYLCQWFSNLNFNLRIFIGILLYGAEVLLLFSEDMHEIISFSFLGDITKFCRFCFLETQKNAWKNEEFCFSHFLQHWKNIR